MEHVLYAVPASHPCAAVERALELKGLPYRRVDLIPVLHRPLQRARFASARVPGLAFPDGRKVAGSRAILRALEDHPPRLFPEEEKARASVERAEEWGEEVLQPLARRLTWAGLRRDHGAITSYREDADLPVPDPIANATAPLFAAVATRLAAASDGNVRADLIHLPGHLDRVDRWIADGTLGTDTPNAGDLQVGAGLALLATIGDLEPTLAGRPARALAERWFPRYPGRLPAGTLPAAWLR